MRAPLAPALVAALALAAGACSSDRGTQLTTATTATTPTTVLALAPETEPTTTAAPTTSTQPATTTPATEAPATTARPAETVASIEVRYPVEAGWTSTATLDGPSGPQRRDLTSGSATFARLRPGTYTVTVTRTSDPAPPGDGVDIGTSQQIVNGGNHTVGAGDALVVTCDGSGCA